MIFALIGNQNCGKTTLFNRLTGSSQHVGNFPGVTVEKKEGRIILGKKQDKEINTVVDLPGIYSLSPYTSEEIVTRDFLINERPDGIINIIDATNIERNLYLSLQLLELGIPMVIAMNMMDEVRESGSFIDVKKLSAELGIPVVPISASKNEGVSELVEKVLKCGKEALPPKKLDFCSGNVHTAIHSLAHIVESKAVKKHIPVRFAATKLVEGDKPMIETLELTENEIDIIGHVVSEMESSVGTDREAALADMRYNYIEKLVLSTVIKGTQNPAQERSEKIDSVLTNKYLAIPIFIFIMFAIFAITFGPVGTFISDGFSSFIEWGISSVRAALESFKINEVVISLVVDGALSGVGSVLSFMPVIILLFFFLSILEDTGYMARVAFVLDKLLRKIGLSGKSIVPMLIGFGCSVPAVMATRTLSSDRDRKFTMALIPFMSCSAKVPIYAAFTLAFFPDKGVFVMTSLYLTGIIIGILTALIFKNTKYKGEPVPFIMELPSYRFPSLKNVVLHMWEKAKDFISRAFTVIFFATVIIWFFQTFDFRFNVVSDSSQSMLASVGRFIAPIFVPLGFGNWQCATALISGFTAKEAVVSTFAVLLGTSGGELSTALAGLFSSSLSAMSFLIFTLLYTPCVATIAAYKRELGGIKGTLGIVFYQISVAWIVSFLFYRISMFFV